MIRSEASAHRVNISTETNGRATRLVSFMTISSWRTESTVIPSELQTRIGTGLPFHFPTRGAELDGVRTAPARQAHERVLIDEQFIDSRIEHRQARITANRPDLNLRSARRIG